MGKKQMTWSEAMERASMFVSLIGGNCERVEVAGSIRRKKETVGDVEIVCMPEYTLAEQPSLFGGVAKSVENRLVTQLKKMARAEVITPRLNRNKHKIAWIGEKEPRYIAAWWQGVPVDLFMVTADRKKWWGYILWLRTGPHEANEIAVTQQRKHGLCPNNVYMSGGKVFRDREQVPVEDEETMFDVLEMVYVKPEKRSVEAYRTARWRYLRVGYETLPNS